MKKILFAHGIFPGGGAERVTIDIAKYLTLCNSDYKCYVCTPEIVEDLCTEEVKNCLTIIEVSQDNDQRSKEIENFVMSEGINLIIQVVQPIKHIKEICQKAGCKSIFANHGEPIWQRHSIIRHRKKSVVYGPLWKLLWKRYYVDKGHARRIAFNRVKHHYHDCDVYTVLCNDYKVETCKEYGITPEESKIVAIENSEQIVPNVTYDKEKIILFCGRLEVTSKRPDRLLRIWGKVQHRLPDYRLVIVGDGPYRQAMEKQIVNEGLERVDMVGRHSNVEPYYRKASIVCLTSTTEGWPLCMTEAQAHGCIPIAFGCTSGVKDILSPSGVNGFIVTPFDEEEYAQTLLHIAAMSEDERSKIRHSAVEKRAKYTPEVIMQKWKDLIDSLID